MSEQINEQEFNNFTTMSMYEYLELSLVEEYKYRLVGLITPKQRIFNIARRDLNDETLMLKDMGEEIFSTRFPEAELDSECIRLYSWGKNLSVEFPYELSIEQLECFQDILRQIRSFEYDFDRPVYMPVDSRELMAQANSITTPEDVQHEEEKIIGVPLVKHSRVLERKKDN